MSAGPSRQRETLLVEVMLSGLDARESGRAAGSAMLVYLAEMLVERARLELSDVRASRARNTIDRSSP